MCMIKGSKYLFSRIAFLTVLMFVLAAAPAGAAVTYEFYCITNNYPSNAAIGEAQFFVDVTDDGSVGEVNYALFTIRNTGSEPSTISEVYFNDGALLGIAEVQNGIGVAFTQDEIDPVNPPNLPGGETVTPPFIVTEGFSADANPSPAVNGVDPNEALGILFALKPGYDFGQVEADLASGALRIGLHAISIGDNEESEAFVNTPIPASVLLLGSGLIGLVGFRRKKIAK